MTKAEGEPPGRILLFTVDLAFQISGRGCVLVPGLSTEPGPPTVGIGSAIQLELPDGSTRDTTIKGVEMVNSGSRPRPQVITAPILLPKDVRKEDVPQGTKVYLVMP